MELKLVRPMAGTLQHFERCVTCAEPRVEHLPGHKWNGNFGYACAEFVPYQRSQRPEKLTALPMGFRIRGVGEQVKPGDYLLIHTTYFLLDGSIWVGEHIEEVGTFCMVWTDGQLD